MYINPSDYKKTFDEIREISKSHSSCKVVIFVSCLDIDALCSAKIISALFKFDLIPHKIMPISGYQELKEKYSQLDDEISSMICLGCGGTIDLEAFFDIVSDEQDPNADQMMGPKIYVIDNHRPWNLDNLFASSRVVCFDDGGIDRTLAEHKEAYMVLQELGEEEEEDSDEDNDGDTDGDEEYPSSTYSRDVSDLHTPSSSPGRRHSKSPLENTNIITSDNEDNTDNDDDDIYYKRHKSDSPSSQKENIDPHRQDQIKAKAAKRELKAMRAKHQALLEEYYMQGTYFHESISSEVYRLVSLIGETNITNLWLMVIGVTSLDVQHSTIYTELFPLLKEEVLRQCPPAQNTSAATNQQLLIQDDYLLFLLRHWSLYQSMLHSSYLSAKLHLWTDDGRKKLHKMLAKMGISLHEAKEHYALMNVDLKKSLASKLKGVAAMYGIEKVFRQGIARRYGYKGTITAGDAVDALAALLEAGADKKTFKSKESESQILADKGKFWISNFWDAWDAVDNFDLLVSGMHKAKALQSMVVSSSTALFEKRLIKDLRSYRLAVIREGPDLDLFNNPLALARLGAWIGEACSESHSQPLPLVVASFDKDTNSYMVLGMGPRKSRDVELDPNSTVYNRFGPAFQATSERINAQLTFDAFESSIIQVSKDDLSRFLENLTLTGLLDN